MKKFLSICLTLVMVLSSLPIISVSAANTYSSNGFQYELNSNIATITGYDGSETAIIIPSVLDGYAVESVGTYAFEDNSTITSVVFPETLKSVGYYSFRDCPNLETIHVVSGDTVFGSIVGPAFKNCNKLTNVTFDSNIQKIPEGVCNGVSSLTHVEIPATVSIIEDSAFENTGLTSITIPKYVSQILDHAFEGTKISTLELPKYLEIVGDSTFENCDNLIEVNVPKNVKEIFSEAFARCDKLEKVVINSNFGTSGYNGGPFEGCSELKTVEFNGVTEIKDELFYDTGLEAINIPSGVRKIEGSAFKNCKLLKDVTIPNTVTEILNSAFANCTSLETIVIPDSVTNMTTWSSGCHFDNCTNLKDVTLSKNLTELDEYMFRGCTALESINIPEKVTRLGGGIFEGCTNLSEVNLKNGLIKIEGGSFKGCTSLENINIPSTVTSIGQSSFEGCTVLEKIVIPYGVEKIDKYAFKGCMYLEEITIPSTVTSIDSTSFTYYQETTVRCVKGSVADLYAQEYDMPVEYIAEKVDITPSVVSGVKDTYSYTGKVITPIVIVKRGDTLLSNNVDYKVSYTNNLKAGTATINITGIGIYEGNIKKTFKINSVNVSKCSVSLSSTSYTYNQDAKKPVVTIKYNGMALKNGTDYTLKYANNINAGSGSVTITGKGNYTGSVKKTFTISKKSISKTNIKMSTTSYTYNGKTKKPTVTVKLNGIKLKNGSDYSISYKNNKYVGSATVTIKGIGNYTGTVIKTFKINPKSTSLKPLSKGKKQITVKWKKQTSQTTGYQIQYSTSKKFKSAKTVTVKKNKTTSTTIKKLKAKKTYYVRIRTYKTVSGKKYYSSWSKVKNVKTK